jgi:hypothetical protein
MGVKQKAESLLQKQVLQPGSSYIAGSLTLAAAA